LEEMPARFEANTTRNSSQTVLRMVRIAKHGTAIGYRRS